MKHLKETEEMIQQEVLTRKHMVSPRDDEDQSLVHERY